MAPADLYAALRHVEATYTIRMYSVYEIPVLSFWR